jgi:hypothetical protein
LSAQSIRVDGLTKSRLVQTGGALEARRVTITGVDSAYDLARGRLDAGSLTVGRANWISSDDAPGSALSLGGRGATVRLTDTFALHRGATFDARLGSHVAMVGADFVNTSVDPLALDGLGNLRMTFSIGPEDDLDWETYEVAGKDLGFDPAGWKDNFEMHTLALGGEDVGELRLVDAFDNQPRWEGDEALYVQRLRIGPGSTLDLNGLHLYYIHLDLGPDSEIINGVAEALPVAAWFPAGDADLSGTVDLEDLNLVLNGFGGAPEWTSGEMSGADTVGLGDLNLVLNHFGSSGDQRPSLVPEPATLALLAIGGLAVLRRRL